MLGVTSEIQQEASPDDPMLGPSMYTTPRSGLRTLNIRRCGLYSRFSLESLYLTELMTDLVVEVSGSDMTKLDM